MKIRTLIVSILGVLAVLTVSPAQEAGPREPEPTLAVETVETVPPVVRTPRPRATSTARTPPSTRPSATLTPSTARPSVSRTPTTARSITPTELRIYELKYINADELATLIFEVLRIQAHPDQRLNRLIVNATKEQMKSVQNLIEAMDVPGPEASTSRDVQNLVYRIYMFETHSRDQGMKPFLMI